jgi:hypothetical protein
VSVAAQSVTAQAVASGLKILCRAASVLVAVPVVVPVPVVPPVVTGLQQTSWVQELLQLALAEA